MRSKAVVAKYQCRNTRYSFWSAFFSVCLKDFLSLCPGSGLMLDADDTVLHVLQLVENGKTMCMMGPKCRNRISTIAVLEIGYFFCLCHGGRSN